MRAVNLLQDEARGQDGSAGFLTQKTVAIGAAGLLVVVVALLGFLSIQNRGTVSDKRGTLASLQQQVAAAQAEQAAADASGAATPGSQEAQLAAFRTAAAARISWDTLMGDVAKLLPAGSWLQNLSMHMPTVPVADPNAVSTVVTTNGLAPTPTVAVADPTTFVVSGFAVSNNVVAKVMQQLELVPMLSDVSLTSTQRSDVGERKAFSFSMTAILSSAGANRGGADQ